MHKAQEKGTKPQRDPTKFTKNKQKPMNLDWLDQQPSVSHFLVIRGSVIRAKFE